MDPIGSEIVKAATAAGIAGEEAAKGLLSRIAGPAADEIGLILYDKVRMYRFKNQVRALAKAEEGIRAAGLKPRNIPMRTLLPLLEGAGLEDDESLSAKWSALIANAAAADDLDVPPSFPAILREMSPLDAKVFDTLYHNTRSPDSGGGIWAGDILANAVGTDRDRLSVSIGNLERLNLLYGAGRFGDDKGPAESKVMKEIRGQDAIFITGLGEQFARACELPM